ncbi:MAG: DNA-3-methyladenine glycosylase II [Parcubacteria bacterium C7867-005]|nr:MAG: DNA-3-methyladenine glycosylase II [Parcubacteria bacterium C7867-005]
MRQKVIIKINRKKLRKIFPTQNPFLSLATSIIYQQISTKAGDTIHKRFLLLFKNKKITPKNFFSLKKINISKAGLSKQKLSYITDLANKFLDETIDPKLFSIMLDMEIKDHLIRVKGIGGWTADMFLIFALNRKNVLPIGDLGIRKGFQKAFKLKNLPSEIHMKRLARPFDGRYTDLSLYLWGILDEK